MSYEFSDEVGLTLRDTYPVMRDGKKIDVKPNELSGREATAIALAITRLSMAFGLLHERALRREMKMIYVGSTAQDHEEWLTNPEALHKVRREGRCVWVRWNELKPQEQAKERQHYHAQYRDVELLPEQQAEADKTKATREKLQSFPGG